MIRAADIYRATHDGLDVILHYYPQARAVVGTKDKFKARMSEKTPSACLMLKEYADHKVWKVVDFGDDGRAIDPVDICMKEEGITRMYEAILKLASMFDVRDELNHSVNKPEIRKRPATSEEKEGSRIFSLLPEIPESHLKILGPKVKREHAEALRWYEAEYVGYVKNREVVLKYSTDNYPIFMRECVVEDGDSKEGSKFYKIYEPLNPEKGFRFSYTPAGAKPRNYINGLHELKATWRKWNADEEAKFNALPENENKAFKEKKLKEAIICSGERDALCCKSMGFIPIWFNSETYRLSESEYRLILKYVEVLYNIPDIDSTGKKKGTQLALQFIDIHTIWLPEALRQFRDNRGKPRKDLRDWMEMRDRVSDFKDLMNLAMPARFWTEHVNRRTGAKSYDIDTECLCNFFRLNGFYTLHDENSKDAIYIRIEGNIVKHVKAKDLRRFIIQWAEEQCLPRPIRNAIRNSPRLSDSVLDNLREIDLDFTSHTPNSQLFFFPNKVMEVTPKGITEHIGMEGTIDRYVWEGNVMDHNVKLMDPMFRITRTPSADGGQDHFDIDILGDVKSCVMGYVINSSRIHWRKEMEYNFAEKSHAESEAYRSSHRFCIDGEGLTPQEIAEQKQNLINKIFAIGYMLHRYKDPSRPWAPQAMDNKIGEEGECNGRSGKSFLFKSIGMFMKTVKLSGRNPKLMDNPHVFDQVTQHTDFILVDDCDRYLSMGQFYDLITSDLTVNPKNNQSYSIPFEQSPKFRFTTNYVPRDFDASTEARLLYMVYSDYYHQRTEDNDYLETRTIRDDFGRNLFTQEYPEADWNADINFFLQCCHFYLQLCQEDIKLLPPMDNILKRKSKADMGSNFEEWAYFFFAEDGDNLDTFIVRREAYENFINEAKVNAKLYSMNRFTKALKAFSDICPYVAELNPKEFQNSQRRISRRINDKTEDMIYLRSVNAQKNQTDLNNEVHEQTGIFIPDEHPEGECPY